MSFDLMKGTYSSAEAIELLTELTRVKIRFHERKIENSLNEEDVKMREKRISELQHHLSKIRNTLQQSTNSCSLHAAIHVE